MSEIRIGQEHANADDARFDNALRKRHAAALGALSPQARAQLAQRRNAALRGKPARQRHGLRYAAAFATLCALAIGLQWQSSVVSPAAPATTVAVNAPVTSEGASATILDEDPEFYAWLATADSQQLALE